MEVSIRPAKLQGSINIPASKSHTIRALILATLAAGESHLLYPLASADTIACVEACRQFGATIIQNENEWLVKGTGGKLQPALDVVNVANSGTTLYIAMGLAALSTGWTVFTGDEQIRRRPAGNLLQALVDLGAEGFTTRDNGCPPLVIKGRLKGGKTVIACPTSQYLTSLLINCPLATGDTEIEVLELNERPYVEITLDWLNRQKIIYSHENNMQRFKIKGNQHYTPFTRRIPADFSSATFFLAAAAITGSRITLKGLDMQDPQGDKEVVALLEKMGCRIEIDGTDLTIEGRELKGITADLNGIPDALPALSVVACFAKGKTELINVPQARLKETDRIAVMYKELSRMGARVTEREDGLVIEHSPLKGTEVSGHADHRVVMALSVAGLAAGGVTTIDTAEAAAVTFPEFFDLLGELEV
jgi:3-phosphoshikimate 1-carboxyvinyltransferase